MTGKTALKASMPAAILKQPKQAPSVDRSNWHTFLSSLLFAQKQIAMIATDFASDKQFGLDVAPPPTCMSLLAVKSE